MLFTDFTQLCIMKYLIALLMIGALSFFLASSRSVPSDSTDAAKKYGLSFVAPPDSFSIEAMEAVRQSGAGWIAAIPYAFTRVGEPRVYYNSGRQWWGERPEGCRHTIEMAHAAGLRVMLKPQVYVPRGWVGSLDFETEEAWQSWENDYEAYILPFAEMAEELDVALFCIGTEFKTAVPKREAFWRRLIEKVRQRYSGPLTYAANWDEYAKVPFWDALDYVGVDAYFPLSETATPSVDELVQYWQPWVEQLRDFSHQAQRPILFTEYGYLSVDGCAGKTWELEKKLTELAPNQQAQANAIDALLTVFSQEEFWAGGFLWKWYPTRRGREDQDGKDYTPQGKSALEILRRRYD